MRAWVTALVLLFGTLSTGRCFAEAQRALSATLELRKEPGTEGCVEAEWLAGAVEGRLARRVFGLRAPADLAVKVRLDRPRPNEWRGRLTLLDGNGNELGSREIVTQAKDCSALDTSLALVVALLVDAPPNLPPEQASPPTPTPAPATAAPLRAKPPPATPLVIPRDSFAPREPWRIAVTAAASGILGVAPRPLFGVAAGLGFGPPRFPEFRVTGEFFPPARLEFEPDRGAKLTLARIGLALCPLEHEISAVRFELCAGQEVGWLGVAGFGFDENQESTELFYALKAGGTAFWSLIGGLGLWFSAALEVPLVRSAYVVGASPEGRRELFQASPITGTGQIGLGIEF